MHLQHFQMERYGDHGAIAAGLISGLNVIQGFEPGDLIAVQRFLCGVLWPDEPRTPFSTYSSHSIRDVSGSVTIERGGLSQVVTSGSTAAFGFGTGLAHTEFPGNGHQDQRFRNASLAHRHPDLEPLCVALAVRAWSLESILRSAQHLGLDLQDQNLPSPRLSELRSRADECRRQLASLAYDERNLLGLRDRQRVLQQQLEVLQREHERRGAQQQTELQDLAREIQTVEQELSAARSSWHRLDEQVRMRRRELEQEWERVQTLKRDYLTRRQADLKDIDSYIQRVREMIADVQRRRDAIDDHLDQHESQRTHSPDRVEHTLCLVETLARQLDAICQRPEINERMRQRFVASSGSHTYLANDDVTAAQLQDLRAEVGRLCHTLQAQRGTQQLDILDHEAQHLDQAERMLQRWVDLLTRQREDLQDELRVMDRQGVALFQQVGCTPNGRSTSVSTAPTYLGEYLDDFGRIVPGRLQPAVHSCNNVSCVHPDEDATLRGLMRERDAAHRALEGLERRLRHLLERRSELEQRWERVASPDVEAIRRELRELDSRIWTAEERERLQRELERWEAEIASCRPQPHRSPIAQRATEILQQLLPGNTRTLQIRGEQCILSGANDVVSVSAGGLSNFERQTVELSLRLALLEALRRRGQILPLFCEYVPEVLGYRAGGLVEVLVEQARQGQQIVLFTTDPGTVQRAIVLGAHLVVLPARGEAMRPWPGMEPEPPAERVRFRPQNVAYRPVTSEASRRIYARKPDRVYPAPTFAAVPDDAAVSWTQEQPEVTTANYTGANHRAWLSSTGVVPREIVEQLTERGIRTVGEFLATGPQAIEREISSWGVSARQIQAWQQELSLCLALPELSPADARLLVRCGITGVDHLASADEFDLWRAIERVVGSSPEVTPSRPAWFHRQRLVNLIRQARDLYGTAVQRNPRRRARVDRSAIGDQDLAFTSKVTQERRTRRRHRSTRRVFSTAERHRRLRRRTSRSVDVALPESPVRESTTSPGETWRFYLSLDRPVVEAPSIGLRMAELLQRHGIASVRDLIDSNPVTLAHRLGMRRVTADVIRSWQSQARLVCQVPGLRGHDAQVLVACKVTDAAQLASRSANELWDVIRPYTETSECKRILRGSPMPDLAEVTTWIRNAQHARPLQAA